MASSVLSITLDVVARDSSGSKTSLRISTALVGPMVQELVDGCLKDARVQLLNEGLELVEITKITAENEGPWFP